MGVFLKKKEKKSDIRGGVEQDLY